MTAPNVVIDAVDAPFQEPEESFDGIRVDIPAHVFTDAVIDSAMPIKLFSGRRSNHNAARERVG